MLFSNYQAISIHPIILGVLKLYEFVFMLWLTLKIAKKIFERFKKSLPNSINKIFYSFDVYLFLPVYSMVSTYYSFASYLLNLGINVKNTGIEDLLKKVAVPFISVGTVAEFWASWLQ